MANECLVCKGKGRVSVMLPAIGNNPYVRTEQAPCGVCSGTGHITVPVPVPAQEPEKSAPTPEVKRVLQKPMRATTLKKIDETSEEGS